jgi:hypothetical protein
MRAPQRRPWTTLLSIAGASASLFLVGCDNDSAVLERSLGAQIAAGRATASGMTTEDVATARQKLESVVQQAQDAGTKAQARATAAQIAFHSGQAQHAAVIRERTRIDRTLADLDLLVLRLRDVATTVEGGRALDPAKVSASISDQLVPAARGDGNREHWMEFSTGIGGLPTLSALQQRKSTLESEIARRKERIAELTRQRDSLVEQSNQALAQSEGETGQSAVESFRRGMELREQADGVSTQITLVEAEIVPIEADLSLAQRQEEEVKRGIESLERRKADLAASWTNTGEMLKSMDQLAMTLVAGGEAGAFTIEGKLAELNQQVAELTRAREAVTEALQSASDDYAAAATAADELRRDPNMANLDSQSPEAAAWRALTDFAVNGSTYRLQQAYALESLASVQAADAAQNAGRLRVREMLSTVAGRLPDQSKARLTSALGQLPGTLEQDLSGALQNAEQTYQQAEDLLAGIIDGRVPSRPIQDGAKIARVMVLYGQSQLETVKTLAGQKGDPAPRLKAAAEAAAQLRNDGVRLPTLPPNLQAILPAAPTPVPEGDPVAPTGDAPAADQPAADQPGTNAPAGETPATPPAADTPAPQAPPAETPPAEPLPQGDGDGMNK